MAKILLGGEVCGILNFRNRTWLSMYATVFAQNDFPEIRKTVSHFSQNLGFGNEVLHNFAEDRHEG